MTRALLPERCMTSADSVHRCDWRVLLAAQADHSVDLVLSDTPYGTTACAWDTVIDLAAWWAEMRRVMRPRGAVVMTASQPYTAILTVSNLEWFKYEWVWEKTTYTGFVHAKNKPLKAHENVLIFSAGTTIHEGQSQNRMIYNPQMKKGKPYTKIQRNIHPSFLHKPTKGNLGFIGTISDGERYPTDVITFSTSNHGSDHPTQKPVALFEYLIRTYTEPGALVLDPFCGSGTTALAARNTGRRYIVGDYDQHWVNVTHDRLRLPFETKRVQPETRLDDLPLFAADAAPEVAREGELG